MDIIVENFKDFILETHFANLFYFLSGVEVERTDSSLTSITTNTPRKNSSGKKEKEITSEQKTKENKNRIKIVNIFKNIFEIKL